MGLGPEFRLVGQGFPKFVSFLCRRYKGLTSPFTKVMVQVIISKTRVNTGCPRPQFYSAAVSAILQNVFDVLFRARTKFIGEENFKFGMSNGHFTLPIN